MRNQLFLSVKLWIVSNRAILDGDKDICKSI